MKLVCKGKVEGFIDGYRYTADRTRALPGAKRCYPENDDVDLIVVLLTGYLTQHPEDKKAPYPEVLKGVIDALYQCKTS